MIQRRRAAERGLTLIEILLALIVMVLGIVGILALFPPALDSANDSMQMTTGAVLGESVANALTNATRFASYDPSSGIWTATLSHDLEVGGQKILYQYQLPRFADGGGGSNAGSAWRHHPGNLGISQKVEEQPAFELGGDPWIKAGLDYHRKENDHTDPYDQFAFSFRVRKINTQAHLLGQLKPSGAPWTMQDLEPLCKLYEYQICLFRLTGQTGNVEKGGTVAEDPSKKQPKRLVAVLTSRVATK